MRRVSSRQRLVSWDAFDASADSDSGSGNESSFVWLKADEESFASGYETALSQSYHSSIALNDIDSCNDNVNDNSIDEVDKKGANINNAIRRRKRDRKSSCFSLAQHTTICKTVESPKTCASITLDTSASKSPIIIASYPWESGKPSPMSLSSPSVGFNGLIDDLHLKIFSFLDLSSLRSVMSINRHYRKLTISNDARNSLWIDHCQKIWHIQDRKEENHHNQFHHRHPPKFIDNFHLPMAAAPSVSTASFVGENNHDDDHVDTTNLSLLLSLTPTNFPTCVDQDILKPRMRLRSSIRRTIPTHRQNEDDQLIQYYQDKVTGRSLARYTGYVGQGDRCLRSDCPMPRPSRTRPPCRNDACASTNNDNISSSSRRKPINSFGASFFGSHHLHIDPHHPFLFNFLQRRGSKSVKGDGNKSSKSLSSSSVPLASLSANEWAPFVVPFIDNSSSNYNSITTVNVTPRFISYYEVSILKSGEGNNDADLLLQPQRPSPVYRTSHGDCVAVGVATENFQVHSRMPGWDRQSFGYHGDDGGIFHATGGMLKQFGPKFGSGDTVGCGIDYISKGIFYTLNGKFLGYAWDNVSEAILEKDLYPVVGLDTNSPVHLNWGYSGPFQFDLSKFIQKHEGRVLATYCPEECFCPGDDDDDAAITAATSTDSVASNKKSGRLFPGLSPSRRHRRRFAGRQNHFVR